MYEAQYRYIAEHKEKYRGYARDYYHRVKNDPVKLEARINKRKEWYENNKLAVLEKQKQKKRERKLHAIEYLGGVCKSCGGSFHPAVFEFHHRDPSNKDRDPSKLLSLNWSKVIDELNKCDLLCANCHRLEHHKDQ